MCFVCIYYMFNGLDNNARVYMYSCFYGFKWGGFKQQCAEMWLYIFSASRLNLSNKPYILN